MKIYAIIQNNPESMHDGPGFIREVAESEKAAQQWISDETNGKHSWSCMSYAAGVSVEDYWLRNGYFTIREMNLIKEQ